MVVDYYIRGIIPLKGGYTLTHKRYRKIVLLSFVLQDSLRGGDLISR